MDIEHRDIENWVNLGLNEHKQYLKLILTQSQGQ